MSRKYDNPVVEEKIPHRRFWAITRYRGAGFRRHLLEIVPRTFPQLFLMVLEVKSTRIAKNLKTLPSYRICKGGFFGSPTVV